MNKSTRTVAGIIAFIVLAFVIILNYYPWITAPSLEVNLEDKEGISDGPYVLLEEETAEVKWVTNDSLYKQSIKKTGYLNIKGDVNYKFRISDLPQLLQKKSSIYEGVEKMAVLSDIHGQYELFIKLLEANKIIDQKGNWNYNKGHLVIIGDAFDRGDKVTETLWHILKLSEQAHKAGGQVHYLLGNHDIMVLNADLRYINDKYKQVEQLSSTSYDQLFGQHTLMGQWLRACPVVLKINDIVFNHAGLSMEMVKNDLSIDAINTTFTNQIIDNHRDSIRADEHLSLLARSQGPIWYRGYFRDSLLTTHSIDSILHHFDVNHIVVGHTSMDKVEVLFDKRILAADTSIKRGNSGELLIIEKSKYYRAGLDGVKKPLWK